MQPQMLVRSRANAPRFLGAFLRTESGGRSGFDPVDLSSKPLDSFDPVVDLGESSAGRDRNPSGPGRLSVRNPPQAAVARPPWPGGGELPKIYCEACSLRPDRVRIADSIQLSPNLLCPGEVPSPLTAALAAAARAGEGRTAPVSGPVCLQPRAADVCQKRSSGRGHRDGSAHGASSRALSCDAVAASRGRVN